MFKVGPVALSAALAASLAACGSGTEQNNQAGSENVMPASTEPANNMSIGENRAAPDTMTNEAQPIDQAAPVARPAEPRRAPPAPKAEPRPRPAEPADPHAGHDMGNMMHNQSVSGS